MAEKFCDKKVFLLFFAGFGYFVVCEIYKEYMRNLILHFIKGFGIGAANVIPGVSGGTVALITGIFERLIDSIKSFNSKALKILLKGDFKEFAKYTDLIFLIAVFTGAAASIFTLARLLDFLFEEFPTYVWAYFFGLILASVFFVGRTVSKIDVSVLISFVVGTGIALWVSFMNPALENDNFFYLMLCGAAGVVSMIVPGLSGSFILILMGTYHLIMIDAVNKLDWMVLLPVGLGAAIGLPVFSQALSFIYKKYHDRTTAVLTGFILGSLGVLWPWKETVFYLDKNGNEVINRNGEAIVLFNKGHYFPEVFDKELILSIALILVGILSIWMMEYLSGNKKKNENSETG